MTTTNLTKNVKTIIENDEFKIIQDTKKPNLYTINFFQKSKTLIQSLSKTKIILGSIPSDDYTSLYVNASSVQTFEQYKTQLKNTNNTTKFSYNTLLHMIQNLSRQLNYLINFEYKTFYAYNTENIIVINETVFVYLSNEIVNINPLTETIEIMYPYPKILKTFYISPELYKLHTVPSNVHYKTIYYSLSSLVIDQIQDVNESINKSINESIINDKIKILESIQNTKLYFLLIRCLDEDIKNRSILFI